MSKKRYAGDPAAVCAFKRSLSSYSNEVVLVFKSTSLAYTITLMEVMGYSQLLYGRTYDVMVFGAAGDYLPWSSTAC